MKVRVDSGFFLRIIGVICAVCFAVSFFMLLHAWEVKRSEVYLPEIDRDSVTYKGTTYAQRKDLDTLLVMGLDKFDADQQSGKYLNRQQSDLMLLLAVDRETKTYSILHLNRDTMTNMSVLGDRGERVDRVNGQLALAHTYGNGGVYSCRNAVEAVSNLLHGVKIDHYLTLTMDAVAILNDLAGGVTVEIMDDFSSVDPTLVQGQTITLQGSQALTYVRSRGGLEDSSNLHRMERQRQYVSALQEQVGRQAAKEPDFYAKALSAVSDYLLSDLTANQMSAVSERLSGYEFTGFETLKGEAVKGEQFMEFYVDEDELMETVLRLYFSSKSAQSSR